MTDSSNILNELSAVCWACGQPITTRQKVATFPNSGGSSRIYHIGRRTCRYAALDHQEQWIKAEAGREPILGRSDPYTGKANPTQRHLLAMAARGELGCHLTRIRVAKPDDDLLEMTNQHRPDADYLWYPDRLKRGAERYIKPLLDAGLLAEPIPQHLGYQKSRYILTEEGWATHRRYPEKTSK